PRSAQTRPGLPQTRPGLPQTYRGLSQTCAGLSQTSPGRERLPSCALLPGLLLGLPLRLLVERIPHLLQKRLLAVDKDRAPRLAGEDRPEHGRGLERDHAEEEEPEDHPAARPGGCQAFPEKSPGETERDQPEEELDDGGRAQMP